MRRLVAMLSVVLVVGVMPPLTAAARGSGPVAQAPGSATVTDLPPTPGPDPTPSPSAAPSATPFLEPALDPDTKRGAGEPAGPVGLLEAPVETATSIVLTGSAAGAGSTVQFHVMTLPAPPGGTVDLLVDGTVVTSATFAGDNPDILLDWQALIPGTYTVTARYNGTTGFGASTSADFPFIVLPPTPYITVTPSIDSPAFDEVVDFTAVLDLDRAAARSSGWSTRSS